MKKFLRRVLILVLLLMVAAVAAPLFLRSRLRSKPEWYPTAPIDPAVRQAAQNSADQKLIGAASAVNQFRADETRRLRAADAAGTQPATAPVPEIKLVLDEQEINAFFTTWDEQFHWTQRYGSHFSDPVLIFNDNELILAATVKDWNTVLSLHFEPRLEKDKLHLELTSVMGGTLPLPQALWRPYLEKLESAITAKLPQFKHDADMLPNGRANAAAVSAAMGELLLHSLRNEPAEPVLFLPETVGRNPRSLPVRVADLRIAHKTLTLAVEPMTLEEREALLSRIRGATRV